MSVTNIERVERTDATQQVYKRCGCGEPFRLVAYLKDYGGALFYWCRNCDTLKGKQT